MSKDRVIVAMSGRVNLSVAATLLKEKGYKVIGKEELLGFDK